jgi:hypothetical protein
MINDFLRCGACLNNRRLNPASSDDRENIMATQRVKERRTGASRRRTDTTDGLPLIDSSGQPVIWNRRISSVGRRKTDEKRRWTKKDIPGFALMGVLFLILSFAVFYLWTNNSFISTI